MHIYDFIWLPDFIEKICVTMLRRTKLKKYSSTYRIFALLNQGTGKEKTCILLVAKQMQGVIVFFILKDGNVALVVSARDMDKKERKRYEKR